MMFKDQLMWIVLASLITISFAGTRTQSARRLRELLLESDEDASPRSGESFHKSSRPKFDPRWFTALSKIARIRTADGRSWNISDTMPKDRKKLDLLMEELSKRKLEIERNKDGIVISSMYFRPRKFHCQSIQSTHVSKLNRTLPAYMCKLGTRNFVLTSERFLQDRRPHVDVSVDESTFLRLTKSSNESNIVPATLVFNKGQNDYGIRRT